MCQAIEGRCPLSVNGNPSSLVRRPNQSGSVSTSTVKRSNRRVLMDREYANLKHLLPAMNTQPTVSKVQLINEAVRYINALQEQVIRKLAEQSGSSFNFESSSVAHLPDMLLAQLQQQSMPTQSSSGPSSTSARKSSKKSRVLSPLQTNCSPIPAAKKMRYTSN